MELNIIRREEQRKSATKKLRREGQIPAVLYGEANKAEAIAIASAELQGILRQVLPGRLSTTLFKLKEGTTSYQAVLKDVQYHPTTYDIIHVDFQILQKDKPVTVKVPIECIGIADCQGIKLGGFLRQVIRYLPVECLPADIPSYYEVDVSGLNIKQSKRLSDLPISSKVRPLAKLKEVVVVIAKK